MKCLCLLLALTGFAATVGWSGTAAIRAPYESPVPAAPDGEIDRIVFARLAREGIEPVLCSDAVFIRRAYLDVTGTLPTAKEARAFLENPDSAHKRAELIDRLLERSEYADYWAMRWGDLLRIKAEFPVNLWPNAAQAYHHWVRASLAANKPYDQFVRELLTSSGSNFRVGPANFYRAVQDRRPEGLAAAVALAFMGTRTERWPAERLAGLAAFFSQVGYKPTSEWKEEHVFWDPLGTAAVPESVAPGRAAVATIGQPPAPAPAGAPPTAKPPAPRPTRGVFPDGSSVELTGERDPRDLFADWLITPRNPWFTRTIVNRMWGWLLGRGVIEPVDDLRPENPPGDAALLAYLESEMVGGRYDLKRFLRLVLTSRSYQLSPLLRTSTCESLAWAGYSVRRLEAEVLIDAINTLTGTTDLYTSPIPEPFTYIPEGQPAVAIADGSITSPFLALFGRSARATGQAGERDHKPIPAQWLHLLNSSHIQRKLEQGPRLRAIIEANRPAAATLDELYLTLLSRFPTPEEKALAQTFGQPSAPRPPTPTAAKSAPAPARPVLVKRRDDWIDLAWSLMNSSEFLYQH